MLSIPPHQYFHPDQHYLWLWAAPNLTAILQASAILLALLAAVLFPLWPPAMRLGTWYLSIAAIGLLLALVALALVRLALYLATIVFLKPGIWLFPNLFEDVGFFDSFVPLWAWDLPKQKKSKVGKTSSKRSAAAAALAPEQASTDQSSTDKAATVQETKA